ncbi:MAG: sortase [Anaerolineae bacterium]
MTTRQLKITIVLIWSGVTLLILGIALHYPTFEPYFMTLMRTQELATAPPLDPELTQAENRPRPELLLPLEDEKEDPGLLKAALAEELPPATPTVTLRPRVTVTPTVGTAPVPRSTPTPSGTPPQELYISSIDLEAPVVPIGWEVVEGKDGAQAQWLVPDWKAVGWHNTSAPLGAGGNTVLNGHNTTRGEVFRDLYRLEPKDHIEVKGADGQTYVYRVENVYIVEEAGQPLEVRLENARYIQPTRDERLTLVTCHPYASTRYRLIVIAKPLVQPNKMPE